MMRVCEVEGCDSQARNRGLCSKHAHSMRRHGDPLAAERNKQARRDNAVNKGACGVDDCPNKAVTKGWCRKHYHAWRKSGDPTSHADSRQKRTGVCSITACSNPDLAKGLCGAHYQLFRKYGESMSPDAPRCRDCEAPLPAVRDAKLGLRCEPCFAASVRLRHVRKTYGAAGLALYEKILDGSARCMVCNAAGSEGDRRLCIDHDHVTGEVRGLLCNKCNTALGLLGDSADTAISLASYILGFSNLLQSTLMDEMVEL